MKRYVQLSVGALSLAFAGITSAAVPILHISGAATFRPPITKGIEDILVSTGTGAYTFGYNGSSRYKPNASIYHGFLKSNNQEVYIETYWTGDLSGIVDLTSRKNINQWVSSTSYTLTTAGASIPNSYTPDTSVPPDASSTVSFYTSSAAGVLTSGTAGKAASKAILNAHLTDAGSSADAGGAGALAIAPFQWVLGRLANGFTAPISNITGQQASALIENGDLPVASFTGNSAGQYNYVFLVGRSEDAGARTVPFAEAQNGYTGQNGFGQAPTQYRPLTFSGTGQTSQAGGLSTGGTNATVTGLFVWPANAPLNTEPNINWNTYGHSGYNLTSDLSNALSAVNPVNAGSFTFGNASDPNDPTTAPTNVQQIYLVGYNGVADTGTLVTNGGIALNYNGVPYSPAAVQTGQYTLWSYAHLYYITSGTGALTAGSTVHKAADDLADDIYLTDADINANGAHSSTNGAGVFLNSSVIVTRPGVEGTPVFPNY